MATTSRLQLFSTDACHLCEQAAELVRPWIGQGWVCEVVDIADSDSLFERYGVHIPVLRREDSGEELYWPFGPEELARFLAGS